MRQDMLSGIGGPMDPVPDDSICCECNKTLPEIDDSLNLDNCQDSQYFAFEGGFCGPKCAAKYMLKLHCKHDATPEFMRRVLRGI